MNYMGNEQRIIVEFVLRNISPNNPSHAVVLIEEELRRKGITIDGIVPYEFYVYPKIV